MYRTEDRYRRLRGLIKKLNRERKKQAKKIDILCNDLIGAQRDFIRRLNIIGSTANFYKSILGITDLTQLLIAAGSHVKQEIAAANVSFFLRQADGFDLHLTEGNKRSTDGGHRFEDCFNAEIVDNICQFNRPCTMEDMLAMGLQANPAGLSEICAVTIPLEQLGRSVGFILLYRWSEKSFTQDELTKVSSVTAGLSRAIQACRVLSQ